MRSWPTSGGPTSRSAPGLGSRSRALPVTCGRLTQLDRGGRGRGGAEPGLTPRVHEVRTLDGERTEVVNRYPGRPGRPASSAGSPPDSRGGTWHWRPRGWPPGRSPSPGDVERAGRPGSWPVAGAVIASVGSQGLGARSLRDLAADAQTSHRMLIHHFGSRAACSWPSSPRSRPPGGVLTDLPEDPADAVEAVGGGVRSGFVAVRAAVLRVLRPRRAGRARSTRWCPRVDDWLEPGGAAARWAPDRARSLAWPSSVASCWTWWQRGDREATAGAGPVHRPAPQLASWPRSALRPRSSAPGALQERTTVRADDLGGQRWYASSAANLRRVAGCLLACAPHALHDGANNLGATRR